MALSIINNPYAGGGGSGAAFGVGLGQSLSQGLSKVLEQQAEQQLYNLGLQRQEQHVQKQVSALAPYLKSQGQGELAELLVRNPQVGIQLLKSQQNEKLWQQEANTFNNLRQYMQGQTAEQTPTASGGVSGISKKSLGSQIPSVPGQQIPKIGAPLQPITSLKPGKALPLSKFFHDIEQSNISTDLKKQKIAQAEKHFAQQQSLREKSFGLKEEAFGLTKGGAVRDFSKPFIDKRHAAEANIRDYKPLIELAKTGNVRTGKWQQYLSKVGLGDLGKNYNTQLADKFMARLAQNVGAAFGTGTRLTNYLEQTFQRSLPSLWNDPAAIVAIAKVNMLTDEANIARDEARKQVLKENNNNIPIDVLDQIEERAHPKIEKLEDEAFRIISNPYSDILEIGSKLDNLPKDKNLPINAGVINKKTGQKLYWHGNGWFKNKKEI